METIKFRGKRIDGGEDSGEWVYGDLYQAAKKRVFIIPEYNGVNRASLLEIFDAIEVDPATVGQFIDRLDKNGKEIFTGDIFRIFINNEGKEKSYWIKDVVKWSESAIGWYPFSVDYDYIKNINSVEVIGNIYENGDLLNGKQ